MLKVTTLQEVPVDILSTIFSHLEKDSQISVLGVCKSFNILTSVNIKKPLCDLFVRNGHLELLKWFGCCEWDSYTCSNAARNGHLEILKWVRSQERGEGGRVCPWSVIACSNAAFGGHLEILKWLRSQDPPCPWNSETLYYANANRHYEVLKWAKENGCEWDKNVCYSHF